MDGKNSNSVATSTSKRRQGSNATRAGSICMQKRRDINLISELDGSWMYTWKWIEWWTQLEGDFLNWAHRQLFLRPSDRRTSNGLSSNSGLRSLSWHCAWSAMSAMYGFRVFTCRSQCFCCLTLIMRADMVIIEWKSITRNHRYLLNHASSEPMNK